MKIATASSDLPDTELALESALNELKTRLAAPLHYLVVQNSVHYDGKKLLERLRITVPGVPIHGGTTCQGVMTERGFRSADGTRALGLFGISDSEGAYGTGIAEIEENAAEAAIRASRAALAQAGRTGESPAIVWITSAPGVEEDVIAGIVRFFGPHVPVCGGSSADNDVTGKWSQFSHETFSTRAVVISVLFPTAPVAFAFQGGYEVTEKSAVVTSGHGNVIRELDGRPAAEVYDSWIGGGLRDRLGVLSNVLMDTSLSPLGRIVGEFGGIPYFQLSHPETFSADRALTLFTKIREGERVYLMRGSKDALVSRPKRVVDSALRNASVRDAKPIGALVIYCAGCMLTVKERMGEVVENFNSALGTDIPFLGAFTFGEQGCFFGGENRHGNLMISALLFLE